MSSINLSNNLFIFLIYLICKYSYLGLIIKKNYVLLEYVRNYNWPRSYDPYNYHNVLHGKRPVSQPAAFRVFHNTFSN